MKGQKAIFDGKLMETNRGHCVILKLSQFILFFILLTFFNTKFTKIWENLANIRRSLVYYNQNLVENMHKQDEILYIVILMNVFSYVTKTAETGKMYPVLHIKNLSSRVYSGY